MAENTLLRNAVLPYPIYGLPYAVVFPIYDNTGALVAGAAGLDSEISKNGDTIADCTAEAAQIATSSGLYSLTFTGTEMTCDIAGVNVKTTTTNAKTTPLVLMPRKLPIVRSGTSASGGVATTTVVLDASAPTIDDYFNGCVAAVNVDGTVQVRMITDYDGASQTATVHVAFTTAVDNNDTFDIYAPEGWNPTVPVLLSAIKTQADLIPGTQDGYTFAQMMKLIAAVQLGKVSGLPTAPVFRSANDAADRVSATTDSSGNRSAVTLTP